VRVSLWFILTIATIFPSSQDLAREAGLLEKLGDPGQFTLFAPTNDAFDRLGSDVLERIMGDKDVLRGKEKRTKNYKFHLLLDGRHLIRSLVQYEDFA